MQQLGIVFDKTWRISDIEKPKVYSIQVYIISCKYKEKMIFCIFLNLQNIIPVWYSCPWGHQQA